MGPFAGHATAAAGGGWVKKVVVRSGPVADRKYLREVKKDVAGDTSAVEPTLGSLHLAAPRDTGKLSYSSHPVKLIKI